MDYLTFIILCFVIWPFYALVFSIWFWFRWKLQKYEDLILINLSNGTFTDKINNSGIAQKKMFVGRTIATAINRVDPAILEKVKEFITYLPAEISDIFYVDCEKIDNVLAE